MFSERIDVTGNIMLRKKEDTGKYSLILSYVSPRLKIKHTHTNTRMYQCIYSMLSM